MSEKYKKTCKYYVQRLLSLALTVTGYVSIFAFASLVCFHVGNTSSSNKHLCNHCRNQKE